MQTVNTLKAIDWTLDKLSSWGPIIISLLGFSSFTAFYTTLTPILDKYYPYSWILAFILSAIAAILFYYIYQKIINISQKNILYQSYNKKNPETNPVLHTFSNQKINISDFRPALPDECIENKIFTECEIFGPSALFFFPHITLKECKFINCDFVRIKDKCVIHNVLAFRDTKIVSCKLYNLTFYVPENLVQMMPQDSNWVTK